MTKCNKATIFAVCLVAAVPLQSQGSWFGKADPVTATSIEIRDSAYVGIPSNANRLSLEGKDRLTHLGISADKLIIRFDFQYQSIVGTLDQYQHGLARTEVSPDTAQLAYDRSTGFILFQKLEKKVDHSLIAISALHPPMSDDTTSFALFQVNDPAIATFLDAALDHKDALEAYSKKHSDCGLGDEAKRALPIEALSNRLPADHVLYARSLKPAEGCEAAWQQIQFAFNSIFELLDPINPGIGAGRSDYLGGSQPPPPRTAVFEDSHLGAIDPSFTKAITLIAQSGDFRPINYDLASVVHEFQLAPGNQALLDKKKTQPLYSQGKQDITKIPNEVLPTALNLYDVLVELRSDKLKAYQHAAVSTGNS